MLDLPPHEPQDPPEHWLVRPETIRLIWIVSIIVLVALVLLEFVIKNPHPYFGEQALFGFAAWYGFGVCAVLVVISKVLGFLLKVRDDYYDE